MDQPNSYAPLRPSSEPNPLRPYYRPPTIGIPSSNDPTSAASTSANQSSNSNFGTSARDILSDLNYNELLGDNGTPGAISIKGILDQLVWRYSSVLMAQPFEVAKTILQVRLAPTVREMKRAESKQSTSRRRRAQGYKTDEDEERDTSDRHEPQTQSDDESSPANSSEDDDDAPSYFTSNTPSQPSHYNSHTPKPRRRRRHQYNQSSASTRTASPSSPPWRLSLAKPDSLLEVLSQLWTREGAWGVWKGANITFIYSLLLKTVETWTRSMLSAVLNLPDAGFIPGSSTTVGGLDIIDSPSPLLSLGVAVTAAGLAGLVLAPLDIARTRLILTPTLQLPRTTLATLRTLPSYLCPSSLLPPTLLHSTLPTLISTSTPLLLRNNLRIDPILTPTAYSTSTFLSSAAELFLRLPIETVLRRGQMREVLLQERRIRNLETNRAGRKRHRSRADSSSASSPPPSSHTANANTNDLKTSIPIGPYTGVISTLWAIMREEGETAEKVEVRGSGAQRQSVTKARKGQGVHGLWRGWRVGWWGLVGVWGAAALGGAGGRGGEF